MMKGIKKKTESHKSEGKVNNQLCTSCRFSKRSKFLYFFLNGFGVSLHPLGNDLSGKEAVVITVWNLVDEFPGTGRVALGEGFDDGFGGEVVFAEERAVFGELEEEFFLVGGGKGVDAGFELLAVACVFAAAEAEGLGEFFGGGEGWELGCAGAGATGNTGNTGNAGNAGNGSLGTPASCKKKCGRGE